MSQFSKNFSEAEFKCPCCQRVYITPELVSALQELRDLVAKPIKITSGYRCAKQNAKDGGTQKSYHLSGKAADITIPGLTVKQMFELAEKVEAFNKGGIGIYPMNNFIHVDVRIIKARWARITVKKKTTYVSLEEGLSHV